MKPDTLTEIPAIASHPRPGLAEFAVALLTAVAAFAWFFSRLSPGVSFGPWQGAFLSEESVYHVPLLSEWFAQGLADIAPGNIAWRLNLGSAFFAALACGMVAATAMHVARATANRLEAFAAGIAAAAFWGSSPLLTYAATGGAPSSLTALLALSSFFCLVVWKDQEAHFGYAVASAVLAGLAAANHPSFGLLYFLLTGVTLSTPRKGYILLQVLVPSVIFFLLALIPFAFSMLQGESLGDFLSHALLTPYPNPGDAGPNFGYARTLAQGISPMILVLALPGLLGLFRKELRGYMLVTSILFLGAGPFLPALTNRISGPQVLNDPEALDMVAFGAVCVVAATGVLLATRVLSTSRFARPRRMAFLVAVIALALVLHTNRTPNRNHSAAHDIASEVLKACPQNVILVSANPSLTSILAVTQITDGLRPDIDILPADLLSLTPARARLRERHDARVVLEKMFPSDQAVERWQSERPAVVQDMVEHGLDFRNDPEALDLALWDLVMDNPDRWPITAIGVNSPWLLERAQLSTPVMCYPRYDAPPAQGFVGLLGTLAEDEAYRDDPGIGLTFADILLPASDLLSRQLAAFSPKTLIEQAEQLGVDSAQVRHTLAQSAARQGNRTEAMRYAAEYLASSDASAQEQETLSRTLEDALNSGVLHARFQHVVQLERQGKPDDALRDKVSEKLWSEDEIGILAEGYRALAEAAPDDPATLYEYAGALTQLGELPEAQRVLEKAAMKNPNYVGQRLKVEQPRFALLRIYHLRETQGGQQPSSPAP